MTVDNVFVADQGHRWAVAFAFGLAFGFALSIVLKRVLQFAGAHFLASVLSFDLGVMLGELFVLALLVPLLVALFRVAVSERVGVIVLSALVCHTAWHWMISRIAFLTMISWPLADLIELMRWGMATALIAAAVVFLVGLARRFELRRRFFSVRWT
jgi:HupE/UreJ protein